MKLTDVLKEIKNGAVKPYILIAGSDGFMRRHAYKSVLHALNIEMPEMNLSSFEQRPDMNAVLNALSTFPFGSERRAVVIKNTDILATGCPTEETKPLENASIPQTSVLIIYMDGAVDKRKSFYKHIKSYGYIVDCDGVSESDMHSYIINKCKKNSLLISSRNAQLLSEVCGGDMEMIESELEKLKSVCSGEITKEDIEKYTIKSSQYSIFKIHDSFVMKNTAQAEKLIEGLLMEDQNPVGVIALLYSSFRQMFIARSCLDARMSEQKAAGHIMEQTGAREWAARKAVSNAKKYPAAKIRRAIKKLADMDFDAKQGRVFLKTDLFALLVDIYF